jgi:hypothetical protein
LNVSAVGSCPKEVAMTDSGFRSLMLFTVAVACASLSAMSDANAEETGRTVSDSETTPSIEIVPGLSPVGDGGKVVIAPDGQTAEENDSPILVAPYEEKQSDKVNAGKKPAKHAAKLKPVTKKKEAAKSKPAQKKPAPMAKETASEKAREEWQKKRSSAKAAPKNVKAASDAAARSGAGAKKRAMMANGPSTAGAVASAKASTAASKTSHSSSASDRKDSRSYREIYNSIPFSRAEYNANPAYRHQATMEIMLGLLHPLIVAPPAPPCQESTRDITVRFLPAIRPGYRPYSQYPWH